MTSGFNISKDITQDPEFNEMIGFTQEELVKLMEEQNIDKENQNKLIPIMKENYDGYRFSIDANKQMYNSNMCLYFLSDYVRLGKVHNKLVNENIDSGYSKLKEKLKLCQVKSKMDVIEKAIEGKPIVSEITQKFNVEIPFREKELISMLFYLGYLTITGEQIIFPKLNIPNKIIKELYV